MDMTDTTETIQLVIPGVNRHSGFLGLKVEMFILVCTEWRIIFARQTTQMMKENVAQARQEAEQQGKNFFGKWGAQFGANSGKQYWEKQPEQILAEQPDNFALRREELRSIRLREQYNGEDAATTHKLEFETAAGKHKFRLGDVNAKEYKKQFQRLYGNIVR